MAATGGQSGYRAAHVGPGRYGRPHRGTGTPSDPCGLPPTGATNTGNHMNAHATQHALHHDIIALRAKLDQASAALDRIEHLAERLLDTLHPGLHVGDSQPQTIDLGTVTERLSAQG